MRQRGRCSNEEEGKKQLKRMTRGKQAYEVEQASRGEKQANKSYQNRVKRLRLAVRGVQAVEGETRERGEHMCGWAIASR
jgi:DNA polymerase III alpha subunit